MFSVRFGAVGASAPEVTPMARRLSGPQGLASVPSRPVTSLDAELFSVIMMWEVSEAHSAQTYQRMTETVNRFVARLSAQSVRSFAEVTAEQARAFVLAPSSEGRAPEVNTQHARRTALRTLYATLRRLQYAVSDPTLDLVLAPRGVRVARPLTEDEVTLCRAAAQAVRGRRGTMRATAWALGETGALSSEITAVRIKDLDSVTNPWRVWLPGTRRARARWGELNTWANLVLAGRVLALRGAGRSDPDTLLAYGGSTPPGGAKAQATVCNALRDVLQSAGLGAETDVRPSSLRHWVGRTAFDAGAPIEQVARLLGHRSLDATAQDIALDWDPEADHR
jgi:integrase/recombinase XerC